MRIGLAGYFGFGNFGDELFVRVLTRQFSEHEVIVLPQSAEPPFFRDPPEQRVEGLDAVVIGGGDLLIPHWLSPVYWNDAYLSRPVFIAGVGVPDGMGDHPDVVESMGRFFKHPRVRYIQARDETTAAWISSRLKPGVLTRLGPDLACSLPLPEPSLNGKVLGVITRKLPGESGAVGTAELRALTSEAAERGYEIRQIILGVGATREEDLAVAEAEALPGARIVTGDSIDELIGLIGECSAVASMRFHGYLVAMMMGIPSMPLMGGSKFSGLSRQLLAVDDLPGPASGSFGSRPIEDWPAARPDRIRALRDASSGALRCLEQAVVGTVTA